MVKRAKLESGDSPDPKQKVEVKEIKDQTVDEESKDEQQMDLQ